MQSVDCCFWLIVNLLLQLNMHLQEISSMCGRASHDWRCQIKRSEGVQRYRCKKAVPLWTSPSQTGSASRAAGLYTSSWSCMKHTPMITWNVTRGSKWRWTRRGLWNWFHGGLLCEASSAYVTLISSEVVRGIKSVTHTALVQSDRGSFVSQLTCPQVGPVFLSPHRKKVSGSIPTALCGVCMLALAAGISSEMPECILNESSSFY